MQRAIPAIFSCSLAMFALAACGGGSSHTPAASPTISAADAAALLKQIALQPSDAGATFVGDPPATQTNDDLANARPDTDSARNQYAGWGQALQLNAQYSAPGAADLVFSGKIARVTTTATLFEAPGGAAAALAYTRELPAATVANFLVNEAAGTKITDTQVVKDIAFPTKGDESFAWRLTGKAIFADGFTVAFVADAVFVRAGRVNGNVTAIAYGQAPKRDDLIALVDTFVERARAHG